MSADYPATSSSLKVTDADRVANKVPVADPTDNTALNADWIMSLFDCVLGGKYRHQFFKWTIATRPASPEVGEVGYNTDINGPEIYTGGGTDLGWLVISGIWDTGHRPTGIAPGSRGFNTDIDKRFSEYYNGSIWVQL